jgi:hypothetical protein
VKDSTPISRPCHSRPIFPIETAKELKIHVR